MNSEENELTTLEDFARKILGTEFVAKALAECWEHVDKKALAQKIIDTRLSGWDFEQQVSQMVGNKFDEIFANSGDIFAERLSEITGRVLTEFAKQYEIRLKNKLENQVSATLRGSKKKDEE